MHYPLANHPDSTRPASRPKGRFAGYITVYGYGSGLLGVYLAPLAFDLNNRAGSPGRFPVQSDRQEGQ
jgi:hypothetical protein